MVAARLLDVDHEGRQVIDRYELVAEIASGGMATVYLARLSGVGGFQRFFAIKRLHPHLANEKEFVDMFLDEARLAAGIHHPNVVPILEVGASPRGYYLIMEYIEGDTLARLLARAATSGDRLPIPIALKVVLDTLSGLHAAHELRDELGQPAELVHRDVSPQNILVGVDGICRITDFGVARAATRLSGTRVGQLKGKIAYMAPEQAMGLSDIDRRADVFAAGVVLWEAIASRRLFKSTNEAATLSRVIGDPIPNLREVVPELAGDIADVVAKALDRDRERRHPTCAHFADALERAATAAGSLATSRELATYVASVLGDEISQQRDAVRAWLARSEPSQIGIPPSGGVPASSVSAASLSVRYGERSGVTLSGPQVGEPTVALQSPEPARSRQGVLIGVGVLILVMLGVVLFFLGRSTTPVSATTPTTTTAPATGTPSQEAPPKASSAPTVSAPPALSASPPVASAEPSSTPTAKKPPPKGTWPPKPKGGDDLPSNPYR